MILVCVVEKVEDYCVVGYEYCGGKVGLVGLYEGGE